MTAPARKPTAAKAPADSEPITDVQLDEVMDSMTGYDELAIEQELGRPFEVLAGADKTRPGNDILLVRAMIAVHRRHEGDPHTKAWTYAMKLSLKDAQRYFPTKPKNDDDVMTPELTSESGKDVA